MAVQTHIHEQESFSAWTTRDIPAVMQLLQTKAEGLSTKEATARLASYGYNRLKKREWSFFTILFRQIASPFVYLLFAAIVLSFAVGELHNGIILSLFLLVNVSLSCFQEAKAHHAMALLQHYLPAQATVMRDGTWQHIDKTKIVPGDIVYLQAGDMAPADMRVMNGDTFLVDESALTGESIPVAKQSTPLEKEATEVFEAHNIIFAGTMLSSGQVHGVVVATGFATALGAISRAVTSIEHQGAYERSMLSFSKTLLRASLLSIIGIYLLTILVKGHSNAFDFSIFAIALLVSIVPEALPAVITFAMSQGAMGLAKKGVIVKRLSAIEDLGDIEILCTDKTGTLTENKLKVLEIHTFHEHTCMLYALIGLVNGGATRSQSNSPFDGALKSHVPESVITQAGHNFTIGPRMPFDSFRMRESLLATEKDGHAFLIVKGAPDTLVDLCEWPNKQEKDSTAAAVRNEETLGHRTLAIAFKPFTKTSYAEADEHGLQWLGYITFADPLKKTAKETIQLAKKLNVEIKVITGDSPHVARAIGGELGLIDEKHQGVITGKDLENLVDSDFDQACQANVIFARISPTVKSAIIASLQKSHDVGFLGEGLNDSPALKSANVGVVVQEAVDLARDVADIILVHKDLKVLVEGIRYGRGIFANVNKYLRCTLSSNFGNAYSMAIVALFVPFLPILPVQILLINLLSDLPALSYATDTNDVAELKKPKAYAISKTFSLIIGLALVSMIIDLLFFGTFYQMVGQDQVRTLYFILSIITEIVLVFSVRTRGHFWRARRPSWQVFTAFSVIFLTTIILPFTAFGQKEFLFVAPAWWQLGLLSIFILGDFFGSEAVKLWYYRHYNGGGLNQKR